MYLAYPSYVRLLRPRHRGAAVITALLIVTLAVTIVSGLLWRQQIQIRAVENQRLRAQAAWIQRSAVDWARLILADDLRRSTLDHLGEVWAVPIAETRLSDFLAIQGQGARDGAAAFDSLGEKEDARMAGRILDAQARFNLTNLIELSPSAPNDFQLRRASGFNLAAISRYARLLQILGIQTSLAESTARYLLRCMTPESADGHADSDNPSARPPDSLADLAQLPGYDAATLRKLENYVVILPRRTPVNANTASAEVLAAVIEDLPLATAQQLVRQRERAYFKDSADLSQVLLGIAPNFSARLNSQFIDFQSGYFEVIGQVRYGRAFLTQQVLISRSANEAFNKTRIIRVQDLPSPPANGG